MNHILIVDDEAEIRESLGEILKEEGTPSPAGHCLRGHGTAAGRFL